MLEAVDEVSSLVCTSRGQVSDRYRSSADAASEQLRLMKEAQLLQDQLKRSEARCDTAQPYVDAKASRV